MAWGFLPLGLILMLMDSLTSMLPTTIMERTISTEIQAMEPLSK